MKSTGMQIAKHVEGRYGNDGDESVEVHQVLDKLLSWMESRTEMLQCLWDNCMEKCKKPLLTTVKHIAVFTKCCKSLASLAVTPFFHVALYENFQKVETDATASGLSV